LYLTDAQDLNGLAMTLSWPQSTLQFVALNFPPGSLLHNAPTPLVISRSVDDHTFELGLSLTNNSLTKREITNNKANGPKASIQGSGLLGTLHLRLANQVPPTTTITLSEVEFHGLDATTHRFTQATDLHLRLAFAGDFNTNGRIDLNDFLTLADHLGKPPQADRAVYDLDGDGRINRRDADLLIAHLSSDAAGKAAAMTTPDALSLAPAYPNPFNAEAVLAYTVPQAQHLELKIYNTLGQEVRRLLAHHHTPGSYRVVWDGRDDSGRQVHTGAYFATLRSQDQKLYQRLMLLR
jgi:hypothetical protein